MKLLYLSEHKSCLNYQVETDSGFMHYCLGAGEEGQVDNSVCFCVLFLLEGELSVEIGRFHHIRLKRNHMVLIPQQEANRIQGIAPAECLLLFWNKQVSACDRIYFDSLQQEDVQDDRLCVLPVREPLMLVVRQLISYLNVRLVCRHMHIIKQQEVLLLLRGFYAKRELAAFFAGTTGVGREFETLIMENYKTVKTVKEFADLCCMSERSFNRKFHAHFRQSPYRWMQERKAELVREEISNTDATFQEISTEFGFSSSSHLTCYCRKHFGMTPSKLREQTGMEHAPQT